MTPRSPAVRALSARLARYAAIVEIGIGRRPALARSLAATGTTVTATDIVPRAVPPTVEFVRDDAIDPDMDLYRGVDAIYARNCPPELHRPIRAIARSVGVPFLFTTLGGDPPAIPVTSETLPEETLFEARTDGPNGTVENRSIVRDRSKRAGIDGR